MHGCDRLVAVAADLQLDLFAIRANRPVGPGAALSLERHESIELGRDAGIGAEGQAKAAAGRHDLDRPTGRERPPARAAPHNVS